MKAIRKPLIYHDANAEPQLNACLTWGSCNRHLLGFGQRITRSIRKAGITGYQFGAPGVSDGISMGMFQSFRIYLEILTSYFAKVLSECPTLCNQGIL